MFLSFNTFSPQFYDNGYSIYCRWNNSQDIKVNVIPRLTTFSWWKPQHWWPTDHSNVRDIIGLWATHTPAICWLWFGRCKIYPSFTIFNRRMLIRSGNINTCIIFCFILRPVVTEGRILLWLDTQITFIPPRISTHKFVVEMYIILWDIVKFLDI